MIDILARIIWLVVRTKQRHDDDDDINDDDAGRQARSRDWEFFSKENSNSLKLKNARTGIVIYAQWYYLKFLESKLKFNKLLLLTSDHAIVSALYQ